MTQNDMLRRTVAPAAPLRLPLRTTVVQQPAPAKDLTPAQRCYQTLMRPDTIAKIATALPRGIDANRFMRVVWTECRKNQSLVNATPDSLISSCITAAQLGLEVGSHLGQAYLVPFLEASQYRKRMALHPTGATHHRLSRSHHPCPQVGRNGQPQCLCRA